MEKHKLALIVFAFSFYCFNPFLLGSGHPKLSISKDEQLQTYIVHVQRPKYHEHLSDEEHEDWHRSFLPNTTLDSGEPRLVYSYRHAISGFSARLTPAEVKAMESKKGFLSAKPRTKVQLATTHTPSFLGLDRWVGLWPDSSMGEGIIIGVIDSGITPDHPSFKDDASFPLPPAPPPPNGTRLCGFHDKSLCNNKLIAAMSFKGGYNPSPRDNRKDGHGTHVAGIAAGSFVDGAEVLGQARGTAAGTAPRAHLISYRACFKPRQGCGNDDILAAMNRAINDGVDVLSMSLVPPPQPFYDDNMAIGSLSAIRKGIFVSMAAGNTGPMVSSVTNNAPWILTVGASSHERGIIATVKLGNGLMLEGQAAYQPSNFHDTLPIAFPGFRGQNGTSGCLKDSFNNTDVKNKIVLCAFEEGAITDMGINVKRAGGKAMVVISTFREGSTTFSDVHVLPAAHVNYTEARKIVNYFKNDPAPTATIFFNGTAFGARPAPRIGYFSARGPSLLNGGIIKPDIVGPGVNILSAWPVKPGPDRTITTTSNFSIISGTSMATPHLSGIAALLKSTHRQWSPAAIKSAIMTTASRFDRDGNPIVDDYDALFNPATLTMMGSGQVDPTEANDPGLIYDIEPRHYIQYLCGLGYNDNQVSMVASGDLIQCSTYGSITSEELNYPSISISLDPTTTKTITREVTNVGDAPSTYISRVEEPNDINVVISPSTLHFSSQNQTLSFTVQFSSKGAPLNKGHMTEGQLLWDSSTHLARSPILVTIA